MVLQVSTIDDRGDFQSVMGALKSSGFAPKQIDTLWNIVGAVVHLVCILIFFLLVIIRQQSIVCT
jgi:myosin heavy subunit